MSKIKSLICEERPREKLSANGAKKLSNAELLAILLNNGSKAKSAIDLGEEIIQKANGIKNITQLSLNELMEIDGIGIAKASRVIVALELSKRITKLNGIEKLKFDSPTSIYNAYAEAMGYLKKEIFKIVLLDTKNNYIKDITISKGSLSASIVHPREVMLEAIKHSASKIILLHNHPSGDPQPSDEDENITNILKSGGELLGIPVLDHIIIGDGKYFSFREKNLI